MLLLLMFAFLGFAATGANAGVSETCGPPIGMFPFHADRFAGVWYGVSHNYFHDDHKHECFILNYTVIRTENATKLNMLAEGGRNGSKTIELRAQELWWGEENDSSVSHAVWRPDNYMQWIGVMQHIIKATDYTTYAITHSCMMVYSEYEDTFHARDLTLVLSRTPVMDSKTRELLESVASTRSTDSSVFYEVKNSDCWK